MRTKETNCQNSTQSCNEKENIEKPNKLTFGKYYICVCIVVWWGVVGEFWDYF